MDQSMVHIMIDGSHVVMRIREMNQALRGGRPYAMDYQKLVRHILGDWSLGGRSTICLSKPPNGRAGFMSKSELKTLDQLGFNIKKYALQKKEVDCRRCGHSWTSFQEKPVDAGVVGGMYRGAIRISKGDEIALISGDEDFYEEALFISQCMKIPVRVLGFEGHSFHKFVRQKRFSFEKLDDFLMREPTRSQKRPRVRGGGKRKHA